MAGRTRSVDVTTTPIQVTNSPGDSISGQGIAVKNPGTNTASVWAGYSNTVVAGAGTKTSGTAGTGGWEIAPGEVLAIDLDPTEALWLRSAAGTVTVQVAEVGV